MSGGTISPLLTDLYQLTMAYGYWKTGRSEQRAAFHLFFRSAPFDGGYTVAAGMEPAIRFIEEFRFRPDDLAFLTTLSGMDGTPLWEPEFLDYLASLRLTCDVEMVREGTLVFPQEPLVRVTGPVLQAQLLETTLLNLINFQTLVATKACRTVQAADGDAVVEFGLRRAQGPDGGLSASRAAYIGGCEGTSNVLAGQRYGIPLRGTHAHSWVLLFGDELEAFLAYAEAMPNNVVLLVDTFDTLEGVRNAITVGLRLREAGQRLGGIRLDSGDLAWLSQQARALLDAAGLEDTGIVATSELDEYLIEDLKTLQKAEIDSWGVGTRLVTAYDTPALGGVYKLTAVQNERGEWEDRIKLSNQAAKTTTPGILQVRRFTRDGLFEADMIYDARAGVRTRTIVDPLDPTRRKEIEDDCPGEDLLVPAFREGRLVYDPPALTTVRERVRQQIEALDPTRRRLVNPHSYPAGLELSLHEHKTALILEERGARAGTEEPAS
jgi:nicotinate phosphoribosyltransferase